MKKDLEEIELLKQQNELLKLQIEYNKKNTRNNKSLLIIIAILFVAICAFLIYLFFGNESASEGSVSNHNDYTETEKQCLRWENTYNFDWCEYSFSSGCVVTGQECVEWK